MTTIGQRIRERRRALGLSQVALAQRSGVHAISIVRIEGGREPRPSTLAKLATALDVPPSAFVSPPQVHSDQSAA